MESIGSPALWLGFSILVLGLLALDLGVFHRRDREPRMGESLFWTVFWITLALAFNLGVYVWFGPARALEFFTGYLIEKSLSVDNIFVFLVLLTYFRVPSSLQHRVLFWGILGALIMRALFIWAGTALLTHFHWVIYVFGVFLVWTGWRLLKERNETFDPERSRMMQYIRRLVPATSQFHGHHFVVKEGGRWLATPLLVVLLAIEAADLVFAVDSIPAIFAITQDPFIVYTSNIFAILGLRALYFVLVGAMARMRYLRAGLAVVLAFVGMKMLLADVYQLPVAVSLGVIALVLGATVAASLWKGSGEQPQVQATN